MLFESAGKADSLCRLNDWERCSIPIRSLEIGLKHRQLDTVSFFLKSRENGKCLFSLICEDWRKIRNSKWITTHLGHHLFYKCYFILHSFSLSWISSVPVIKEHDWSYAVTQRSHITAQLSWSRRPDSRSGASRASNSSSVIDNRGEYNRSSIKTVCWTVATYYHRLSSHSSEECNFRSPTS